MNGKIKKVLQFVVCAPAFSQRNMTSIGLVILFVLVYILAGGKVTTSLPSMSKSGAFGIPEEAKPKDLTKKESKSILGEIASKDRAERDAQRAKLGSLFTDEEREEVENEEIDPNGLVGGTEFVNRREKRLLEKTEKKSRDSLSAIEERLKSNKNAYITD